MATYRKPADLARAIKGVLFGTINHLVDTFNWLVSCWDNVKAGRGIKLEGVNRGAPEISANIVEGDYIRIEDYQYDALRISVDTETLPLGIDVNGHIDTRGISFTDSDSVKFNVESDGGNGVTVTARFVYV